MLFRDLIPRSRSSRNLIKRDSSNLFDLFNRDVSDLFGSVFKDFENFSVSQTGKRTEFAPRVNISEDDKAVHVSAELPGMEDKDIEVTLKDQVLTIKGEKKTEVEEKEKSYHRVERRFGSFQRSIRVPDEIQEDQIKASFKNGLLDVVLPKSEKAQEKARRIEVKAA